MTVKRKIWSWSYKFWNCFLKAQILSELVISVSKLFHSIIDEGSKLFLKKLYLMLNKGILSQCLVLYDLKATGTNL